jgi:hypothetical protein
MRAIIVPHSQRTTRGSGDDRALGVCLG